jgi:hypothetical protein
MVSNPEVLICHHLLGEFLKQCLSSFLILSGAYGNYFAMSPQGHVGGGNLCKLSYCDVEVGSCHICCMLLGLSDGWQGSHLLRCCDSPHAFA